MALLLVMASLHKTDTHNYDLVQGLLCMHKLPYPRVKLPHPYTYSHHRGSILILGAGMQLISYPRVGMHRLPCRNVSETKVTDPDILY